MTTRTMIQSVRRAGFFGAAILLFTSFGAVSLPSGFGVRFALAQPSAAPSATLLKRLAEAVDGHRTGATVFLVAAVDLPHDVIGVFESRDSANSLARQTGGGVDVFGPFQTIRDPGPRLGRFMKCVHLMSAMKPIYCPGRPVIPFGDLDSVAITFFMKNGPTQVIPVPLDADALFLTLSSLDKFVMPYYTRILGVEEAARMRARIVANMNLP